MLEISNKTNLLEHKSYKYSLQDGTCVLGHCDVGVDAVTHHCDLVGLELLLLENTNQHIGVGFAQRNVGLASRGVVQTFAD